RTTGFRWLETSPSRYSSSPSSSPLPSGGAIFSGSCWPSTTSAATSCCLDCPSDLPQDPSVAPSPARLTLRAESQLRGRESRLTPMTTDGTVCVVDDESPVRRALARLIRSEGLSVETFPSAQAFLDHSATDRPMCLVLDVQLPGRSGLDLQDALTRARLDI